MKNLIKKVSLIVFSALLMLSFLQGNKKKNKKNINKYIFAGGNRLVVFDGEKKTVQKKKFKGQGLIWKVLYFPKLKKILIRANNSSKLYSVNANNLHDNYQVNLRQFNQYGKYYDMVNRIGKYKNKKNIVLVGYEEWDKDWNNGLIDNGVIPDKYWRIIKWDITKNIFTPATTWQGLEDDPYEARNMSLDKFSDRNIKAWKKFFDNEKKYEKNGTKKQKKEFKTTKRIYKNVKKFSKLLKKDKINVGNYNQMSDLEIRPTGGRYMIVRNDKLYLVHMKTKKVYTLWDDPWKKFRHFIIEKNEDDVDLDAE